MNLGFCFGSFSFTNGCSSQTTSNNGVVTGITNNVTSGLTEALSYDSLNRVLSGQTQSNSASGCWGEGFGSSGVPDDRYSNLSQIGVTQCSGGSLSVTVSPTTNQVTTTAFSYDADGDMTADASYTYTYDAENRITSASGMTGGPYCYVYDGDGLRVEKFHANGGTCANPTNKVVDALYWRTVAGQTIAETDGSGNTLNEYVFFSGQRIARLDSSGNVYYYYTDQIGSTVAITTGSGTACYQATFTPYGEEHATQNSCPQNYKFAGYERDAETGLDYAFARYYNQRLGRFMTADPMGLGSADPTDPQTLNAYAYVRNSPVELTDPSGLDPIPPCVWVNDRPVCPPPILGWGGGGGGGAGPCSDVILAHPHAALSGCPPHTGGGGGGGGNPLGFLPKPNTNPPPPPGWQDCVTAALEQVIATGETPGQPDNGYGTNVGGTVVRAPLLPIFLGQRNVHLPIQGLSALKGNPQLYVQFPYGQSSAFGRYQITNQLAEQYNITDWTPRGQDNAVGVMLQDDGAAQAAMQGNLQQAFWNMGAIRDGWASMPDSPLPGNHISMTSAINIFNEAVDSLPQCQH